MKKGMMRGFFLTLLLLPLLIQGAGCGTARGLYHSVRPEKDSRLKKRVLLVPIIDQAGLGKERTESLTSNLLALLGKDGGLILSRGAHLTPSAQKSRSPQFGIIIDTEQAEKAEKMGVNVLITAVANPMEVHKKKTGIWPFRSVKKDVEISLAVNAFDVVTGTLFLTHLESRKVRVPVLDEGDTEVVKQEMDEQKFDKALSQIIEAQATAIGRALAGKPWFGKILSAGPETVVINGGQDIGFAPGLVLEVYGQGETIPFVSGRGIDILGPKAGEIRIVEVQENKALAVPLGETPVKPGQVIKLRP